MYSAERSDIMLPILFILGIFCSLTAGQSVRVDIKTDSPIFTVDEEFLSVTLDLFLIVYVPKWLTFDFHSPRVITLLKGLSPGYLRYGGTPADYTVFTSSSQDRFTKAGTNMATISPHDFDNMVSLSRASGFRLLWDANLLLRYGTEWDPSNMIELFDYLKAKGYDDIIDLELGNEPDLYGNLIKNLTGEQIAKDFVRMNKLRDEYGYKGAFVGPDTVIAIEEIWLPLIKMIGQNLTAVTVHHYYFGGQKANVSDYINPENFAKLPYHLNISLDMIRRSAYPNLPLWLGETSDSHSSGTPNVTDKFVSGFLWMDKLGVSASMGIPVVIRQDFYGHYYPLIGNDLYPNPDYWLSHLHKLLVGVRVLKVNLEGSPRRGDKLYFQSKGSLETSEVPPELRAYAHCTKPSSQYDAGSVTLFALSVMTHSTLTLTLNSDLTKQEVDVYLMTPGSAEGLLSRVVNLNGHPLEMPDDGTLPDIFSMKKQQSASGGISIPPLSYGFFVFPKANVKACQP